MSSTVIGKEYAVLIGDIVSSRKYEDQKDLLESLSSALDWVNERTHPNQPLQMTIGDEFQGAYPDLGQALEAALYIQLRLRGLAEFRFGIGWGEISHFDPEQAPRAQSGPAWWAAREAIESLSQLTSKKLWPRTLTTRFHKASDRSQPSESREGEPLERIVNSFLLCRDAILANLDERDARITLALFLDERQEEVAKELDISQPAVAKRLQDKGPSAIFRAHEGLRGIIP